MKPSSFALFYPICILLVGCVVALFLSACVSPSNEGPQGRLKATMPIAAELIFD